MARLHLRDALSVPRSARGLVAVAVAVIGPFLMLPIASLDMFDQFRATPFLVVILAASLLGRLSVGLVAVVLSVILLDYNFIAPEASLESSATAAWALGLYACSAILAAYIVAERDVAAAEATAASERLELVARAGDLFSDPSDYEATLHDLGNLLVPRLADWFVVNLLEDGELRRPLVVHPDPEKVELAHELQRQLPQDPEATRGAPNVVRTGRSELIETITDQMLEALIPDPEILAIARELGLRCAMTVPLTARGRTFGALSLVGAETHARYSRDDLRLAEEIADRAALAIDTARLFAAESEARAAATADARRNEVLKDVTAAFGSATTVEEVMTAMLEQGVRLAGAAAGTVGLVAGDDRVDLLGVSGYELDDSPYWHSFGLHEQLPMAEAIRERKPVIVSTTEERDRRYPLLIGRGEQRDHPLVCLPLFLGDQAIGAFSASYPPGTAFGEADLTFVRAIGEQCAQAIDRARSVTREQETRARFNALANASRGLARSLDYDETLRAVVRLATQHLGTDATLYLRERDRLVAAAVGGASGVRVVDDDRSAAAADPPPAIATSIERAVERRSPGILKASDADDPPGVVLPLTIADSNLGALVVREPVRDFRRADELEFAREIARRMARAIENSRLYRERDYVARTLQRSLLPPELPPVPGIDVQALFLPAFRGYEVGGDFYDVFETPNGRWAAVIGDVCGKGVEAATLTGLARHTLRAVSDVERPSEALVALNGALLRENVEGRFCTVAYVLIEPERGGGARLRIAAGGHPLPHHVSVDAMTRSVGRHGTLLGITEDPHLEDVEVRLDPGEALVLFTDGILRKEEAFGDEPEGLIKVLQSTPPASAAEVTEQIRQYVDDLIAEEQKDDIAILVLRAR